MPTGKEVVPETEEEISLLDVLLVLVQRKWLIGLTTIAAAVLAIGISLWLPAQYTATVTIMSPQQNSSLSSALSAQLGSMAALAGGGLGLKNPNDMYVAMFKSRTVEDAMVRHYGLMQQYHLKFPSDACKVFEGNTKIDGTGKDGLIHISVTDLDPRRAAELANGYVDQFRGLTEHLAISEAAQRRLFFEKQLEEAKNQLANAEEELKKTEQSTGVISVDNQSRALLESATALKARVAAQEVAVQGMRTYATGQNAELMQAEKELESLRAQLAQLGGASSQSDDLLVPKGKIPQAGLEYLRKERDVKYYETIFEILAKQFEVAKLDEAKEGALVQVVDSAVPPDRKSAPKRSLIVIAATFAGFLAGIFAALLLAACEHMKADPKSAGKLLTLKSMLSFSAPAFRKS